MRFVRRCRYLSFCFLFSVVSVPAFATTDFALASQYAMGFTKTLENIIRGKKSYSSKQILRMCGSIEGDFFKTELDKLKYNDKFHDLKSEEQAQDIRDLQEALKNAKGNWFEFNSVCKEKIRLWLAYDQKWYREAREQLHRDREAQRAAWSRQVVDTGKDVWDGVMRGVHISIPREYIYFGSREKDGYSQDMNLQFFYPDMTAYPQPGSDQTNRRTNIGGLLSEAWPVTRPCFGFENKTQCTQHPADGPFVADYLDCYNLTAHKDGTPIYAKWLRFCGYSEGSTLNLEPEFDEEVDMWRLGKAGYFEGDPEFPDYWFICEKPTSLEDANTKWNRTCRAGIAIGDRLDFIFIFPRHLFWQHREIHERVKAKIESFIVPTPNAAQP